MAEIIQKDFKDLRKGDRILVESIVYERNEDSVYVVTPGGEIDEDGMTIDRSLYHGCLAPKPKTLKVGMKFNFGGSVFSQIYAISGETVFYFCSSAPHLTCSQTVKELSRNPNLKWIEE